MRNCNCRNFFLFYMRHLKWKLLKKEREREEVAGVRTRNWKLYNLSQKEELRKKGNRRDNQLIKKKKQKTKVILFFFEIFVEFGFYKWIFLTTLCVFSWPFFLQTAASRFCKLPLFLHAASSRPSPRLFLAYGPFLALYAPFLHTACWQPCSCPFLHICALSPCPPLHPFSSGGLLALSQKKEIN